MSIVAHIYICCKIVDNWSDSNIDSIFRTQWDIIIQDAQHDPLKGTPINHVNFCFSTRLRSMVSLSWALLLLLIIMWPSIWTKGNSMNYLCIWYDICESLMSHYSHLGGFHQFPRVRLQQIFPGNLWVELFLVASLAYGTDEFLVNTRLKLQQKQYCKFGRAGL